MKLAILCAIFTMALPIGAVFAGEDSTQRYHGTGPEWYEVSPPALFQDADSAPDAD